MLQTRRAISALRRCRDACSRFRRQEDGALIIFTLFVLVCMLIFVSVGIDVMRSEVLRTKLQNTSDRAVLAAADLEQSLPPEIVAADYFTRAGLSPDLVSLTSSSGLGNRQVDSETAFSMPTMLLRLVGNDIVDVTALSTAREAITNVEISLVLDYSMSMRGAKYNSLIAAATSFVDTVYDGPAGPGTSINYVPYAGAVNTGATLFALTGGQRQWPNSSCIEMDAADFATSSLPSGSRDQVPHFERYYANDPTVQWGWCPPEENRIRPATQDREALKQAIQTSKMNGGTGTDIAMKYGVALLDPVNRPVLTTMATQVPAADKPMAGRPLAWTDPTTQKYIILMTDGGITGQLRPKETGFIDDDEDDEDNENDVDEIDGIDYDKINAEILIHNQTGQLGGNGGQVTKRNKNTSLANFYAMCDAAKDNGVTVFTIAYNAPNAAQTQMQTCASAASMFYNIENLDIGVAFGSIALQINRLRLVN